ncbi:hypothetical protein SUGI_0112510 [Cryptomeria japonica]|uniref:uncharacterized protein LOC131028216 n=1 Tax=Cryptomeria japonica TaxID=3369 RepID=UPI002408D850|nr:uncharacterized protein LOC131028216 [Cryptomeria japonica]GLJ09597.1 hypothetical protein SUGI_0112510 [Cryptomeria japonica]
MAAKTAAPIFPMPVDFEFDQYCLGPEMDYAKVLAEAKQGQKDLILSTDRTPRRQDLLADISCFSGHFKASAEDQSLKTNRRSWKSSLLGLWRKAQKKNLKGQCSPSSLTTQHPGFKSRCKPAASGPLYLNDVRSNSGPSYCRSARSSTPLAALFTGDAGIPYMSLNHHTYNRKPAARPIYLVT